MNTSQRNRGRLSLAAIASTLMMLTTGAAMVSAAGPAVSPSGKSLVVPRDQARLGTVYHALPGRDRQVFFESDAPLEKTKGQSNAVIGYVVAGPDNAPAKLQAGQWRLPVTSMDTGIELRNHHMASKEWLNADEFPDITFTLSGVESVKPGKSGSGFNSYTGTLVGSMTIHGVTNDIRIPNASITFLDASDRTRSIASGDLLAIRASYSVTLTEFGVNNGIIGGKVANEIAVETVLFMSTTPPERQR